MSMDHDFVLVPENLPTDYSKYDFAINKGTVKIHDDVLRYFIDTLKWIPTINPCFSKGPTDYVQAKDAGLNFWGPTVINHLGARQAAAIFRGWAELLKHGPPELQLTGSYCFGDDDKPESNGFYKTLLVDRNELVKSLNTLANYADQAATGDFYIVHCGI